ncbi:hypothetical protein SmJEL517_g01014 [Synchytrium microbalum]|uniref:Thioredoxin n=1 Tax=Synchytrium microbalum TaxID=1806994 RepID=A0A507CHQ1_9FUNG|nr:uncharacterized protein SmJEL517_g01014 [Synchytrium microbalum]TPX37133.1 hypothetical protein SmJEL517_g01014 [Synchytrium microbalum]
MVHFVQSADEFHTTIAGDKVVFVDFFATWCGPCKAISPIFEKLSSQFPNAVFIKVDVDEIPDISEEAGIRAMPTFQTYKAGKKIAELVGADPKKLEAMIVANYVAA